MQTIVIIPARYASHRLPGKPLADICGKPMVQRVYEQALKSKASRVIIATDHQEIKDKMQALGYEVCMTSKNHQSGTDRLAEVVETLKIDTDSIIVNVQGDEPLIPPETIDQVANLLVDNPSAKMSTLSTEINSVDTLSDPNVVKVIANSKGEAIYFSRSIIPYCRETSNQFSSEQFQHYHSYKRHIGLYAYRAEFIKQFSEWSVCEIEQLESLEQLRVLWKGEVIQVADAITVPPEGIDTARDLQQIRNLISQK